MRFAALRPDARLPRRTSRGDEGRFDELVALYESRWSAKPFDTATIARVRDVSSRLHRFEEALNELLRRRGMSVPARAVSALRGYPTTSRRTALPG